MKSVSNLIAFIGILYAFNPTHAQVVLRFQTHITMQANTLGDILQIEQDDENWMQVNLQSHPKSGETITKRQIMQWMTRRFGAFDSVWIGATQVQVEMPESAHANRLHHLIKKGERIQVKAMEHNITIMMDAITLMPAQTGQLIEVQNPVSQKNFWVRITGSHEAEALA